MTVFTVPHRIKNGKKPIDSASSHCVAASAKQLHQNNFGLLITLLAAATLAFSVLTLSFLAFLPLLFGFLTALALLVRIFWHLMFLPC